MQYKGQVSTYEETVGKETGYVSKSAVAACHRARKLGPLFFLKHHSLTDGLEVVLHNPIRNTRGNLNHEPISASQIISIQVADSQVDKKWKKRPLNRLAQMGYRLHPKTRTILRVQASSILP